MDGKFQRAYSDALASTLTGKLLDPLVNALSVTHDEIAITVVCEKTKNGEPDAGSV